MGLKNFITFILVAATATILLTFHAFAINNKEVRSATVQHECLVTTSAATKSPVVTTITTTTEIILESEEEEEIYYEDEEEAYFEENYNDYSESESNDVYETSVPAVNKNAGDRNLSDYEYNLLVNLTSSEYGANWVPTEEKSKIAATILNLADTYYDGNVTDAIYEHCVPYGFDPSYDYYKDESIYDAVDNAVGNEDAWSDWTATGWFGDGTYNYFN